MRLLIQILLLTMLGVAPAAAQTLAIAAKDAPWNEGAPDCTKSSAPPLEIHRYDAKTFILRENLCATWEAPFMYLLIGEKRALLIDTGDVADPKKMPLAQTVSALVAQYGGPGLSLIVVHTHRHLDHRAGDPQFTHVPGVTLVGYDIDSVKRYYGFKYWPNGIAHVDLGNRTVDVIPTPGHNETHVAFYDEKSTLLFSGDFLMPGRLLLDDPSAGAASAKRISDFVRNRPVSSVLGGHIEMNKAGQLFPWESTYHPDEHALTLTKDDVLALPNVLVHFNGFYETSGPFIVMDPMRNLLAVAAAAVVVLVALIMGGIILIRRLRHGGRRRRAAGSLNRE